jgi:hypothetical protein
MTKRSPLQTMLQATAMSERIAYTSVGPAGVKALSGVFGYVVQCGLPLRNHTALAF